MISRILKYTLVAVAAAVIAYAGLTVYGEVTRTEAARLPGSVQLAQNQAENMNRALLDVGTFAAGEPPGNASETQLHTETPDIAKITDIDALMEQWEPRYDGAKLAYVKFEAAIKNAKASAAAYFATQQALTEQINDPAALAQARQDDVQDLALYRQWEAPADSALNNARAIGTRLDDMDALLRKLHLRADFVFDATSFQEVPAAILELNQELNDFRVASETIRATTGSPFEVK